MVAYIRDYPPFDGALIAAYLTMEAAREARQVAGDLVFNPDHTISQSDEWLWDWEKANPNCYARRAQRQRLKVGEVRTSRYESERRRW